MEYQARPHEVEARAPNLFLAASTVALLAIWSSRISRRWWLGPLAATAYASSPEVFVRSSYGGYYAIGAFASILMMLCAENRHRRSGKGHSLLSGMFAALSDHKLALLAIAAGLRPLLTNWWHGVADRFRGVPGPIVLGFAAGTILFWSWGLAIAPVAFVEDHFRHHLIDRITHHNPFGYGGYPSPLELWVEFIRHTSFVLLPIGLALLLWDVWRSRQTHQRLGVRSKDFWLLWFVVTAATFTAVDWRMTKHLTLLVLPLCLGLVPDRTSPRWRVALSVATLLLVVSLNLWTVGALAVDFASFEVTPSW